MSRWIDAADASFRYVLEGDGPRTVVLLHEVGGTLESWDALAALLVPRYRVLRYDQRGFGMSERAATLSLEQMGADVVALMAALGVDRAHLVGTALGGSAALVAAAMEPARVISVTATSPVTGDALPEPARKNLLARADLVEREGIRAIAQVSLDRSYPPEFRTDPDTYDQYRLRYLANDPRSIAALSRAFLTLDLAPHLDAVTCPALIVGCTRDAIKPAAECEAFAARLTQGRFAALDSGHFAGFFSPAPLAVLLESFWRSPG